MSPDCPLHTDEPESKEAPEKEEPEPEPPAVVPQADEGRKSRKHSRLSCLRRRRRHHPPKAGDDSDLSEGFESDSSHDSAQASDGSDSGSDKSLEGRGTAFDAETDSEMNSQESRSDLEDMEDEEGTRSPAQEPPQARSEAPDSLNGPLVPSEASIASNLQAMSTQMFQTKRCFRLAPTFSNLLLQPTTEPNTVASHRPCVNGDVDKPLEPGAWVCLCLLLECMRDCLFSSDLTLGVFLSFRSPCPMHVLISSFQHICRLAAFHCRLLCEFTLLSPHSGGCTSFPHGIQLPQGSQKLEITFLSE